MKTSSLSITTLGIALWLTSQSGSMLSAQQSSGTRPTIQGVWRIVERTTTGPAGSTNKSPQGGVWIFTGKHYSQVAITGDQPRPDLPDPAKATADDFRATWGPVVAAAGTYQITGNVITLNSIVHKNPAGMKAGVSSTFTYKLEGNTLETNETTSGVANPVTLKLTRLE